MNHARILPAALFLLAGTGAGADDQAVNETNYQIGYASGDTRVGGGTDTNAYGVNGSLTLPLGTYFGASVAADYLRTNVSANAVSSQSGMTATNPTPECALNTGRVDTSLFVRSPSFGRVGAGYGRGRTNSSCDATFVATGSDRLDSTTSRVDAELYIADFTFAAARVRTQIDGTSDINSSTLSVAWYPTPNLRTTLAGDGLDFKDTYRFQLEHQPEIFDNTTGLLLEYMTRRQDISTYYIGVGIKYYFNKRVELKTRDREYR